MFKNGVSANTVKHIFNTVLYPLLLLIAKNTTNISLLYQTISQNITNIPQKYCKVAEKCDIVPQKMSASLQNVIFYQIVWYLS